MNLFSRMPAARPALVLAAIATVGVAAYMCHHVRSRMISALTDAAASAGLRPSFEVASVWPGRITLNHLVIAPNSRAWTVQLSRVELRLSPIVGAPRRVEVLVPQQRVSFRAGDVAWESRIRATAALTQRIGRPPLVSLQTAEVSLREGVLRSRDHASRQLQSTIRLHGERVSPRVPTAAANREHAETLATGAQMVVGTVRLRGPAGAALLELLHAEAAVHWLFPQALGAPLQASANVIVTPAELRLDDLHATCGDLRIAGALAWEGRAPRGSMLLTTPIRRVGLTFSGGAVQVELTPGEGWLDQRVERSRSVRKPPAMASQVQTAPASTDS